MDRRAHARHRQRQLPRLRRRPERGPLRRAGLGQAADPDPRRAVRPRARRRPAAAGHRARQAARGLRPQPLSALDHLAGRARRRARGAGRTRRRGPPRGDRRRGQRRRGAAARAARSAALPPHLVAAGPRREPVSPLLRRERPDRRARRGPGRVRRHAPPGRRVGRRRQHRRTARRSRRRARRSGRLPAPAAGAGADTVDRRREDPRRGRGPAAMAGRRHHRLRDRRAAHAAADGGGGRRAADRALPPLRRRARQLRRGRRGRPPRDPRALAGRRNQARRAGPLPHVPGRPRPARLLAARRVDRDPRAGRRRPRLPHLRLDRRRHRRRRGAPRCAVQPGADASAGRARAAHRPRRAAVRDRRRRPERPRVRPPLPAALDRDRRQGGRGHRRVSRRPLHRPQRGRLRPAPVQRPAGGVPRHDRPLAARASATDARHEHARLEARRGRPGPPERAVGGAGAVGRDDRALGTPVGRVACRRPARSQHGVLRLPDAGRRLAADPRSRPRPGREGRARSQGLHRLARPVRGVRARAAPLRGRPVRRRRLHRRGRGLRRRAPPGRLDQGPVAAAAQADDPWRARPVSGLRAVAPRPRRSGQSAPGRLRVPGRAPGGVRPHDGRRRARAHGRRSAQAVDDQPRAAAQGATRGARRSGVGVRAARRTRTGGRARRRLRPRRRRRGGGPDPHLGAAVDRYAGAPARRTVAPRAGGRDDRGWSGRPRGAVRRLPGRAPRTTEDTR